MVFCLVVCFGVNLFVTIFLCSVLFREVLLPHCRFKGYNATGLEKSAAIRPFATKKSRLASEKILLADSLATESCRLADRLATKLFFKANNADADQT